MYESLIQMQRKLADVTSKLEKAEGELAGAQAILAKLLAATAPSVPEEWRRSAQRLIDAAGDKTCSLSHCNYPMDCCSHELIGAMDAMSALLQHDPQSGSEPVAHHPV